MLEKAEGTADNTVSFKWSPKSPTGGFVRPKQRSRLVSKSARKCTQPHWIHSLSRIDISAFSDIPFLKRKEVTNVGRARGACELQE